MVDAADAAVNPDDGGYIDVQSSGATALSDEDADLLKAIELSSIAYKREEEINDGEKLLAERLTFLHLHSEEMADDGNCQFRAFARELFGSQETHALVRASIICHMQANPTNYQYFIDENQTWAAYIAKMALDGTWGDELTIRACADTFNVGVHVITSDKENWLHEYQPSAEITVQRRVFLCYIAPVHYNTVRLVDGNA